MTEIDILTARLLATELCLGAVMADGDTQRLIDQIVDSVDPVIHRYAPEKSPQWQDDFKDLVLARIETLRQWGASGV